MDVEAILKEAVDHHRNGRPVDAHRLYKQVLTEHPNDPDALHLLGMLTFENGNPTVAADLIRRATAGRPRMVDFHLNLSRILRANGKLEESIAALRQAIEISPLTSPATYHELAHLLIGAGRHAEAVEPMERAVAAEPAAESLALLAELLVAADRLPDAYRAAMRGLSLRPDWAPVHAVLASIQDRQGDIGPAETSYRRALDLDRNSAEVCNNLGWLLLRQTRTAEATELLRRAVQLRPAFPQAHNNLGRALAMSGKLDDAIASFHTAVGQAPRYPEAWDGLGQALLARFQWGEAIDALRRAVALKPSADTYLRLATATGTIEDMDGALDALRRAVALTPTSAEAFHLLGINLRWSGQLDEAIAASRRALALDPNHVAAHSALCYALLTHDRTSAQLAFAAHAEWGQQHADPVEKLPDLGNDEGLVDASVEHLGGAGPSSARGGRGPHPPADGGRNLRSPRAEDGPAPSPRKLRVGYISNSFRSSAIMAFIAPILAHHDHAAVEVICYSDTANPDDVTAAARRSVDLWRRTAHLSDEQLARQIRDDRIDVLVELTGHLGGGRLLALARRPAPVQVSYLGYQGTTGVAAVDYVLTDDWADPPGAEMLYVEQPWRLPRPFFCWRLPTDAPDVGPPPLERNGFVTFGCMNAVAKATPAAVALWGRVLSAVPDSQMVVLTTRCLATDQRLRAGFVAAGVHPRRVRFVNRVDRPEYLARYTDIDVALDPIPFVGHTTTCDAAWMGCPTVTLAGQGYAQRYGGSVLRAVGLGDLVAESDDGYVRAAVALASDPARLAAIRAGLREVVRASPFADAAGFTRDLEAAYRAMWAARR